MLTGTEWNESTKDNYYVDAYQNSDALKRMSEQQYDIGIYTEKNYLSDTAKALTTNYGQVKWTYEPIETYEMMLKTSMYKMVPFTLKPRYVYYSGDVFRLAKSDAAWNIENDIPFYSRLMKEGVSVNSSLDNAFRFYHMRGPHAPYYLSEDIQYEPTGREVSVSSQGRGSLKIVYEYLEQMKKLGVYDDATIIITADHGQSYIMDSDKTSGQPDRTSRPIFIVKRTQEKGNSMKTSDAPVSQEELMPTILEAMSAERLDYGRTFNEIAEDEQRVRMYVDDYSYFSVEYIIDGDAADLESWSIKKAEYYK